MSPAAFLRDRALSVAVAIVCAIAIGSVVAVLGAGPDASVLAACIVLACAAFALTVDYARRRAFYRDLEQVVGDLDRTYYATALIEPPDFLEGRLAYEALQATGKAAADDVAAHKQQAEAYRDYIELWIHEIKTPIAAAALMASGLHGPQAARIKGELDRIEGYVEQALYYARSTSLVQDYAIRETSLAEAVREALRKHARFLIERGVAPTVDVDEDVRVFADVKWLAFVIGQLVANAGKYGASTLRFSVREEGAGTSDARTVLEVADDGWGVPAGDVPRVFERLHRRERQACGLVHGHGAVPRGRAVREDGPRRGAGLGRGEGHARAAGVPARSPQARPAVVKGMRFLCLSCGDSGNRRSWHRAGSFDSGLRPPIRMTACGFRPCCLAFS